MALVKGTNCGFVITAPSVDPAATPNALDNTAGACKDTAPVGMTIINELGVWIDNATEAGTIYMTIYEHDSGNNRPGAQVAGAEVNFAKGTTSGWKKITGLNISLTPGNIYWIAAGLTNTATTTNSDLQSGATGERVAQDDDYTLPDPWGGTSEYPDYLCSVYAVYETIAGIMTLNTGYWGAI